MKRPFGYDPYNSSDKGPSCLVVPDSPEDLEQARILTATIRAHLQRTDELPQPTSNQPYNWTLK